MKRTLFALAVALVTASASSANAQAPKTVAEAMAIVRQALDASEEIRSNNAKGIVLARRIKEHTRRLDEHNANPCTPRREGDCAEYNDEADRLDEESRSIQNDSKALLAEDAMQRSHFGILMGRLRIAAALAEVSEWVKTVVGCSKIWSLETAVQCLSDAWERHP